MLGIAGVSLIVEAYAQNREDIAQMSASMMTGMSFQVTTDWNLRCLWLVSLRVRCGMMSLIWFLLRISKTTKRDSVLAAEAANKYIEMRS